MKLIQRIVLKYYRNKIRLLEIASPRKAGEAAFELFCTPYSRRKTYEVPAVFEKAEKLTFTFRVHNIHGFGWKPSIPSGRKILICHGFDSFSYRFERYIEPLLKEGFEVFAFDAPGHGLSSGKTINAILYRDMILEVNNKYGPIDGIMAHSFGGIAAGLAIEELKDKPLKRLVLIAPATETTRSIKDFCRHLHISQPVKEALENIIISIGSQPAAWYSVARIIQSISIPVLWLHDKQDTITPYEDMRHLEEMNLTHVTFVITEGLGHSLYRDDLVTKNIIGFLTNMNK